MRFDGIDAYAHLNRFRAVHGYVPQDDIIHTELPLERTLQYAAQLRLPARATADERQARVGDALRMLNLESCASVRVSALSGGQRKRASIAVELITKSHVFFSMSPLRASTPPPTRSWSMCCGSSLIPAPPSSSPLSGAGSGPLRIIRRQGVVRLRAFVGGRRHHPVMMGAWRTRGR